MFWLKIELHSQPKPMISYVIWLQKLIDFCNTLTRLILSYLPTVLSESLCSRAILCFPFDGKLNRVNP